MQNINYLNAKYKIETVDPVAAGQRCHPNPLKAERELVSDGRQDFSLPCLPAGRGRNDTTAGCSIDYS